MSNELTTQQKNSFGSTVMSAASSPAAMLAGSAGIAVKAHGGINQAIKAQNSEAFKNLNKTLKNQGVDVFTRSQTLARGYNQYKDVAKASARANKKLAKFEKKGKLSLWTRFKNLFAKNKVSEETLRNAKQQNSEILSKADNALGDVAEIGLNKKTAETLDNALKNIDADALKKAEAAKAAEKGGVFADAFEFSSKNAAKVAQEATEQGFKTAAKGFGNCFKQNLKEEFGWKNGKFNYFMSLLQFIPNIKNDVIPAFKEEGFLAGMKALGVTTLRAAADLVGYSSGSALGKIIGATIGNIILPGVGSKVGAVVGEMLTSVVVGSTVTKGVDKLIGVKEEDETAQNETVHDAQNQEITQEQMQIAQAPQQTQAQQTQDLTSKYANMPSKDEIKKLAYAQAFQGQKGRFNSYYA